MTPENFCYWLKGYFETHDQRNRIEGEVEYLSPNQIKVIKEHLDYVFEPKITQGKTSTKDFEDALRYSTGGMIVETGHGAKIC